MQVPRSALGKTGLCPACARPIPIRPDNTTPAPAAGAFSPLKTGYSGDAECTGPTDDDKRKFGEAVDLYFAKRYGEALSVFSALLERHPGNPEIETGRALCLKSLQTRPVLALEDKRGRLDESALDQDFVKRLVMHLMVNGSTEEIQLKAAELACRMLGILDNVEHAMPPANGYEAFFREINALDNAAAEADFRNRKQESDE